MHVFQFATTHAYSTLCKDIGDNSSCQYAWSPRWWPRFCLRRDIISDWLLQVAARLQCGHMRRWINTDCFSLCVTPQSDRTEARGPERRHGARLCHRLSAPQVAVFPLSAQWSRISVLCFRVYVCEMLRGWFVFPLAALRLAPQPSKIKCVWNIVICSQTPFFTQSY